MKDVVLKCSLQAVCAAIVLMVVNLMLGDVSFLPFRMPIRLPIDWMLVATSFVTYWGIAFFILFIKEALKY